MLKITTASKAVDTSMINVPRKEIIMMSPKDFAIPDSTTAIINTGEKIVEINEQIGQLMQSLEHEQQVRRELEANQAESTKRIERIAIITLIANIGALIVALLSVYLVLLPLFFDLFPVFFGLFSQFQNLFSFLADFTQHEIYPCTSNCVYEKYYYYYYHSYHE